MFGNSVKKSIANLSEEKQEKPYPEHADIIFESAHFNQMKFVVRVKQC